jgi:hypothetical protein
MNDEQAEMLAEKLIDIVDEYEGLGIGEAELMKKDFIRVLVDWR